MRFLTIDNVEKWCNARGLRISGDRFLHFDVEHEHCFSISLDQKPSRVIALADYLVPTWKDLPFQGALLWIRQRGIWADFSETIGAMILQQLRLAEGQAGPFEERPGHLFSPEELFEMHSHLVIPMLFGWDAFLVPEGMGYFIFISHDGVVGVMSRTRETHEQLHQRALDWNPREEREWYSQDKMNGPSRPGMAG